MPEDKPNKASDEEDLSKQFDEVVEQSEDSTPDSPTTTEQDHEAVAAIESPREVTVPVEDTSSDNGPVEVTHEPVVESQVASSPTPDVKNETPAKHSSFGTTTSGGTAVLQWLSYAFWGWFNVSLAWLLAATVGYFIFGESRQIETVVNYLAYPLAAVIVMYAAAAITDAFYAKREPVQKTGIANVLMLIHVVLYILVAVAALIGAVFSVISLALNVDASTAAGKGFLVTLSTSAAVAVLFGVTAVRILLGGRLHWLRKLLMVAMAVIAAVVIGASILGPIVSAQVTKTDRLIEAGLPSLDSSVQSYVYEHGQLPASLDDLTLSSYATESKQLVDQKLVHYTPNTKQPTKGGNEPAASDATTKDDSASPNIGYMPYGTTYYYKLCVTYSREKQSSGGYEITPLGSTSSSSLYLDLRSHKSGEVCYDRQATSLKSSLQPVDLKATVQ